VFSLKIEQKKNKDTFAYLAFISFKIFTVLDFEQLEQTPTPIITRTSGNVQSRAINFGRQGHSLTQLKMFHCKTVANIIHNL
jgi:uncharacterized protein YkuJ